MSTFDARAKDWDRNPRNHERAARIADSIRAAIPLSTDWSAMEYGCGTALLGLGLANKLRRLALVDTSSGMLDVLHDKLSEVSDCDRFRCIQADLSTDDLGEEYDFIFMQMVLHHVPNTAFFLDRLAAHTKPGGYLAIADLVEEDGSFHGKDADIPHLGFDTGDLSSLLESRGYQVLSCEIAYAMTREADDGTVREFPLFLLAARLEEEPCGSCGPR